jgi:4-hydroxy-3-methylbut-2-en-1-yl diphosphate reductase
MEILLANPRGFCAGVDRAIEIVEKALDIFGAPIWVRHEVVHNEYVVKQLRRRGAIFTDDLEEIPEGAIVIFSAHGVSQQVRKISQQKKFRVFDATCPLVTKVHMKVARASREGWECILIGHAGHPEVEGTMGQYDNPQAGIYLVENEQDVAQLVVKNADKITYVTQTTLSMDDTDRIIQALRQRFPTIKGQRRQDICYATQNRQDAVKELAKRSDVVLVLGSINSSNSKRLKELAKRDCDAYLIDDAEQINRAWLRGKQTIGITAGASAPEVLVQTVVAKLIQWGGKMVTELQGREENIEFALPKELRIT